MRRITLFVIGALLFAAASALPAQAGVADLHLTPIVGATFYTGETFIGGILGPVIPVARYEGLELRALGGVLGKGEFSQWQLTGADLGAGGGLELGARNGNIGAGLGWTPRDKLLWWGGISFPLSP